MPQSLFDRKRKGEQTLAEFLTARGTQPALLIAFSFYAGTMGSWAVTATPNFAVSAGFIGLVMMSISNGLPIIMVAQLGHRVVKIMPDAMR